MWLPSAQILVSTLSTCQFPLLPIVIIGEWPSFPGSPLIPFSPLIPSKPFSPLTPLVTSNVDVEPFE